MARIKKIDFYRVGAEDGCLCDRCGQYIRNIWVVQYADGITARFGIDCFETLNKESGLTSFGQKELKKTLKRIQEHRDWYESEKAKTEETDTAWQELQQHHEWQSDSYWRGRPWKEYHEWMLNEFFGARFAEDQRNLERFGKVNFAR